MVVSVEDPVEVGDALLKCKGAVKELLGCHGEELGLVRRAVGVEEGFVSLLGKAAQSQEFIGTHGYPFGELVAVSEERGAVGSSVEHVELVGELVVNHVMTLLGVARPVENGVPNEDHWPLGEGLPQYGDGGRYRALYVLEYTEVMFGRHYGGWVDEDRLNVAIVVMGESKLQQTRLGRDSDADLVGEFEATTPLPLLLLKEDVYHSLQLGALGVVENAVVGHVSTHEGLPLGGERTHSRLRAAMVAEPVKHGIV